MSRDLTGLEWFFALEEIRSRINGLLGLSSEEIDLVEREAYEQNDKQTREEFRASLQIHDSLLTGSTEEERFAERLWMAEHKRRAHKAIDHAVELISALPVDDAQRAAMAGSFADLVGIGILAGPYQSWRERSELQKRAGKTAPARIVRSDAKAAIDCAVADASEAFLASGKSRPRSAHAFAIALIVDVNRRLEEAEHKKVKVDAIADRLDTLPKR